MKLGKTNPNREGEALRVATCLFPARPGPAFRRREIFPDSCWLPPPASEKKHAIGAQGCIPTGSARQGEKKAPRASFVYSSHLLNCERLTFSCPPLLEPLFFLAIQLYGMAEAAAFLLFRAVEMEPIRRAAPLFGHS